MNVRQVQSSPVLHSSWGTQVECLGLPVSQVPDLYNVGNVLSYRPVRALRVTVSGVIICVGSLLLLF